MSGTQQSTVRPAWLGRPHPAVSAAKAVAIAVILLLVAIPFWLIIATSISPDAQVTANGGWSLWPKSIDLHAYADVLNGGVIGHAVLVSATVTLLGTLLSLASTILLAYALSRPNVLGARPVLLAILFTFLFPAGMIPSFLIVTDLKLTDHLASLFLPVMINVFNLVVMRGFFQGIPEELYEAARLDGAGELRTLLRIVLPLSKAVIAVVGLYYAVAYWNDYFRAMLYLNNSSADHLPLSTILRDYLTSTNAQNQTGEALLTNAPQKTIAALIVMGVVPIAAAFPFLQRFFTKGVLTGAVKS
ncbi:carbohydrate ABC transporter permease [Catenulispora pinisilvae]|uniref:carbohydrate ABC transporter permease n=1 Tax=Catenulispora pinisilvae TaxID=2705253 RepID=UPI0018916FA2|nr:carbohydrate ABC transporter permease [Catenulispora pinisilvae]